MMLMCLPLCLLCRQLLQPIAREDHRRQVNTKASCFLRHVIRSVLPKVSGSQKQTVKIGSPSPSDALGKQTPCAVIGRSL